MRRGEATRAGTTRPQATRWRARGHSTLAAPTTLLLVVAMSTAPLARDEVSIGDAERALATGDSTRALAILEASPAHEDPSWQRTVARCRASLGDWPRAEEALRAGLRLAIRTPERADLLGDLATALAQQNALESAEAAVSRAIELDDRPRHRRVAIGIALRSRAVSSLAEHAERLLELEPGDRLALFARGVARSRGGEYEKAVADLRRASTLDPESRDVRLELALALSRSGRFREAANELLDLLTRTPRDAEATFQLSRALVRIGGRDASRAAARVHQYFETLRSLEDGGSRAEHARAAGDPITAGLLEHAEALRAGDVESAWRALSSAGRPGSKPPVLVVAEAAFLRNAGLLAGARERLEGLAGLSSLDASARELVDEELARLVAAEAELASSPSSASGPPRLLEARRALAQSPWRDAAPALREVLVSATDSDPGLALHAARTLLALRPDDANALRYLAERASSAGLLVPLLHHLDRLARAATEEPERELWAGRRDELRRGILGAP